MCRRILRNDKVVVAVYITNWSGFLREMEIPIHDPVQKFWLYFVVKMVKMEKMVLKAREEMVLENHWRITR